ncbi:amidohydrolase family protein [Paraburkholderia sp.]|uniref:amidohydrolase family protein n=1 Tax=Paraburkholderia sp. TaxID=1926495 RepID=UPI002D66A5FE|nr:amidohydrolase family protein [Paraburkholderia sp.]HZZ02658.1 amidohydrolase family protein [Paraburkholderia sp.]
MNQTNRSCDVQGDRNAALQAPTRIDVHAHFIPSFYRAALIEAGHENPDGMPYLPDWNDGQHLESMDRLGISTAILSVSSPGVHFGDDAKARALSRRINEEGKRLCEAHRGRFGFFASVPLPDVEGAVKEAAFALDELKADGIVVETNHHGVYLGDPRLEPFYAELNRRSAVVFVHPTSPSCHCCQRGDERYPRPMLEFMFETTRSITDMVLSGVPVRYPDIRFIVPHAGAALSVLTERIEMFRPLLQAGTGTVPSMREAMRRLHFDVAGAPVPTLLSALLQVADPAHIHYGSDYPFTPAPVCEALLAQIDQTDVLDAFGRGGIYQDNSLRLFPRFSGKIKPR